MRKVIVFLYGLTSYLLFMSAFVYLIGFLADLLVPKSVDRGGEMALLPALLVDTGLILLFGLQHSVMARPRFKSWLTRRIPRAAERSTYVLVSTLALVGLMALWQPIPITVWNIPSAGGQALMYCLFGLGIMGILATSFQINHFDLFGLRQVYLYLRGHKYNHPMFVKSFLYRLVRNPMHAATIIFFLTAPRMTLGHLLLAVGMSIYALIGIYYEERDLERAIGENFRAYRRSTPSLLPNPLKQVLPKTNTNISPSQEKA